MMNLDDLEAAMRTAKAMGQSKIPVHLFVLAERLAGCREAVEVVECQHCKRVWAVETERHQVFELRAGQ